MTAKEYLSRAYRAKQFIEIKERQIAELRAMADGISGVDYSKDRVSASADGDESLINLLTRIEKLEAKLQAEKLKYVTAMEEVTAIIAKVEHSDYKELLMYRYIDHMTWEQIAEKMHISERHIYRVHGRALACIAVLIPK